MSHATKRPLATMTAVVQDTYGPPEILRVDEVAVPNPEHDEVLVRVHTTAVSPADCAFRQGVPWATRLFNGLRRPKHILGSLFAGQIVGVGDEVEGFASGDRVFGSTAPRTGTHAGYVRVPARGVLAAMPADLAYDEAVAVCDGALTALPFLRDAANLRSGQTVLVNGASGSVGAAAVQLAKHFGAVVTGVCSATNLELVSSLGADEVIDYTAEDFAARHDSYDVIFDAVGKSSFASCKPALARGGIYLTTVPSRAIIVQMLRTRFASKKAKIAFTGLNQTPANLALLIGLAEAGALKPVIDRRYRLDQIVAAHRYVETEHKTGSVILITG